MASVFANALMERWIVRKRREWAANPASHPSNLGRSASSANLLDASKPAGPMKAQAKAMAARVAGGVMRRHSFSYGPSEAAPELPRPVSLPPPKRQPDGSLNA